MTTNTNNNDTRPTLTTGDTCMCRYLQGGVIMALSGSSPPKAPAETLGAVHWTMRRPSLEAFIGMYMESAMSRPKMLASQSSVSPMMLMHCFGVVRCTGHGHPEWTMAPTLSRRHLHSVRRMGGGTLTRDNPRSMVMLWKRLTTAVT